MRIIRYNPTGVPDGSGIKNFIKYWVALFYPLLGYLLVLTHRKRMDDPVDKVSICAIFKNEADNFEEWLEYYLLLGVDKFYLYNNFSDDHYADVLAPYIEKGIVKLIDWPVKYGQNAAYKDCYERFHRNTEWLGFIDLDEFVCFRENIGLFEWLKRYRAYPSVLLNWRMFGTSGKLENDKRRLVIEQFTSCWEHPVDVGKSFINTAYRFIKFTSPHVFLAQATPFRLYIPPVNEFKTFVVLWKTFVPFGRFRKSRAQLNHYWSKSLENYRYKDFVKGSVFGAVNDEKKTVSGRFEYHELNNTVKDYTIQKYLVFLKERLAVNKTCRENGEQGPSM